MALSNLTAAEIAGMTITDLAPSLAEFFICTPEEHRELEDLRQECNDFLRRRLYAICDDAPELPDYRKILAAYVSHVGECEGIDFLSTRHIDGDRSSIGTDLTAREIDVLRGLGS